MYTVILALTLLLAQEPQSAEEYLKALQALTYPPMTGSDAASLEKWQVETAKVSKARGELIWKLYSAFPEHPKVSSLLGERWDEMLGRSMPPPLNLVVALEADIEQFLSKKQLPANQQVAERCKVIALTKKNWRLMRDNHWTTLGEQGKTLFENALKACDSYHGLYPQDKDGATCYYALTNLTKGSPLELIVMERLYERYPHSSYGQRAKGRARSLKAIGQPFELRFNDVATGKAVDLLDYRGKVILIDFWSLGCIPCRLDIEKSLPGLADQLRAKGLVIVGVNIDQTPEDGRDYPLEYLREKKVTWPNYCTRSGAMKGFAADWGVFALPTQFLIDRQGRLRYIDATTDRLKKIEELLAEEAPAIKVHSNGGERP